jgi:hypothetical protein
MTCRTVVLALFYWWRRIHHVSFNLLNPMGWRYLAAALIRSHLNRPNFLVHAKQRLGIEKDHVIGATRRFGSGAWKYHNVVGIRQSLKWMRFFHPFIQSTLIRQNG